VVPVACGAEATDSSGSAVPPEDKRKEVAAQSVGGLPRRNDVKRGNSSADARKVDTGLRRVRAEVDGKPRNSSARHDARSANSLEAEKGEGVVQGEEPARARVKKRKGTVVSLVDEDEEREVAIRLLAAKEAAQEESGGVLETPELSSLLRARDGVRK